MSSVLNCDLENLVCVLGQDSTFFQGILGKMQSKDLKNCPRNSSKAKSSEDSF